MNYHVLHLHLFILAFIALTYGQLGCAEGSSAATDRPQTEFENENDKNNDSSRNDNDDNDDNNNDNQQADDWEDGDIGEEDDDPEGEEDDEDSGEEDGEEATEEANDTEEGEETEDDRDDTADSEEAEDPPGDMCAYDCTWAPENCTADGGKVVTDQVCKDPNPDATSSQVCCDLGTKYPGCDGECINEWEEADCKAPNKIIKAACGHAQGLCCSNGSGIVPGSEDSEEDEETEDSGVATEDEDAGADTEAEDTEETPTDDTEENSEEAPTDTASDAADAGSLAA